ncbi:PREDICTED: uncharacterized protein LOC108774621 [Cyphomyrmex costatus]|uniref:uncharacterized protein LOC108774621 n=1 Tax=Cyphomyrmex costatus TaxID=456900 RepID=UPI0008523158|nr:PREDICTED: uncharacterized protein LOC108774621 [Cyphomyrmex costatus]
MEDYERLERELLEHCGRVATLGECFAWLERCKECIESLECRAKRPRLTVGHRQSAVARIARLEGARTLLEQRFVHVGGGGDRENSLAWREIDAAFANRVLTGAVINSIHIEPRQFLEDASSVVVERVRGAIDTHGSVKVNTAFNGEFVAGDKRTVMGINSKNCELYRCTDLREWYTSRVIEPTLASLDEHQERDSGWALSRILNLTVNVNKLNPMRAGCYVTVPEKFKNKHALVNVRVNGNACFAWSVVAALYPVERNTNRASSYPHYSKVLNFADIEFPVTLKDVAKFERSNDISINVYGIEDGDVLPLRLTGEKKEKHVNLLYVQDGDGHFVCIKNLSGLVGSQINKKKNRKYFCDRCLHYFSSSEKLESHAVDCQKLNECAIRLPSVEQRWLEFRNYCRKERAPFIVYADLECVLKKTEDASSAAYAYQRHEAYSIAYYVHCSYDSTLSEYRCRRGDDCVSWFASQLEALAHRVKNALTTNLPMDFTRDDWRRFDSATHCHICERPFAPGDERVRDHCHLTGRYRGPAHKGCNVNYKDSPYIPVVFHNLSGYDAHFIVQDIATRFQGQVELLPLTKEKYISFTKHVKDTSDPSDKDSRKCVKLRFIDSYKFLSASLDKLASYLDKDKLKIVRSEFSALEDFNLLTRKGVFPYEYVDSVERLNDTRLPPRESFHSSLTGDTVSESDYAHAENVWQRFAVRTLGEYSDLYLKTDVLLLADVFENFRDSCVASYGLDPAHYYTLPGFTWDAMLKHTRVKFELLTDIDMVMFVERGIRGGLSQCSGRYARANNKYMRSYDPSEPSSYLVYYDVNNLYGWAMCQPLPYGDFQWVDDAHNFDFTTVALDSPTGYILEVDLEYPQHLHDAHADLPFCPTREKPPGKRDYKLLATVSDKQRYVVHYRNLQQCTRHGLRVTKIHRVLRFAQSAWLRDYIELNTQFRTRAKNDFEKNLYKLMNNAVFGKTMENVRERVDVKLVTAWEGRYGAEALIAKPNFHSRSVFAENLIAVELRKLEVKFDKPIYVGMCILDISKTCLYEFHHDYMTPLFRDRCEIMYTDTDSLIYRVECDDVYETMKRDIDRFDTSDYPANNAYGMPLANKKVPGLMKDENNGAIMTEFVGLRAKMYALRVDGKRDTKKAKGVKSSVVARTISFEDYTRCLKEDIEMTRRQACIRSKLHRVYTVSEKKIALSPYDDKRYVVPESTNTLPWGHYRIV